MIRCEVKLNFLIFRIVKELFYPRLMNITRGLVKRKICIVALFATKTSIRLESSSTKDIVNDLILIIYISKIFVCF